MKNNKKEEPKPDEATRVANMAIYGSFPNCTKKEGELYREIYANGYRTGAKLNGNEIIISECEASWDNISAEFNEWLHNTEEGCRQSPAFSNLHHFFYWAKKYKRPISECEEKLYTRAEVEAIVRNFATYCGLEHGNYTKPNQWLNKNI